MSDNRITIKHEGTGQPLSTLKCIDQLPVKDVLDAMERQGYKKGVLVDAERDVVMTFLEAGKTYSWRPPRSPHHELRAKMIYTWNEDNGVDPLKFKPRDVATKVLGLLPKKLVPEAAGETTEEAVGENETFSRVLIHGPPASGKSSIMGSIYESLKVTYHPFPVYYVPASQALTAQTQDECYHAIQEVSPCAVLLDDAQLWYEANSKFFLLFKGQNRVLVAAATYSAEQMNPSTPVNIRKKLPTNMTPSETKSLLERLSVDPIHHPNMQDWYGDIYGRYHFLVPPLLKRWEELKTKQAGVTLAETFFSAATMEDTADERFLPVLNDEFRPLLIRIWNGTANADDYAKLVPYGILREDREWSCEYVRRKYFFDLFQSNDAVAALFDRRTAEDELPPERDIAEAGFRGINWNRLCQSRGSSGSGFPVEDIWQFEFYAAIGKYIIRPYTFCKEHATSTGKRTGSVDFVLRNGQIRIIEFLIKSDRIDVHHERFWNGAYTKLFGNAGSYLVVDIMPWDNQPDIDNAPPSLRCEVATACFQGLKTNYRKNHAVYLVSNDLASGILFTFDEETRKAVVYAEQVGFVLGGEEDDE